MKAALPGPPPGLPRPHPRIRRELLPDENPSSLGQRGRSRPDEPRVRRQLPRRRRQGRSLPRRPQGRRGRRLPRHQGGRPLPLARRPRLARDPRLGRGREQGHRRLPRRHPRPLGPQGAAHQALELREVQPPPQGRGPLLLLQEHRLAEPVGRLLDRRPRRRAPAPDRPQHPLARRHRRPLGRLVQRRRRAHGLRDRRGRLGLDRVEGPRRVHRQGPRRPPQVDQVLRRRSSTAASPSPRPEPASRPPTTTRSCITTSSARPSPTTSSSTSGPTTRNGSSAPRSPRTAATSSSRSPRGPTARTASSTRTSPARRTSRPS